jgi:hypothetical protein
VCVGQVCALVITKSKVNTDHIGVKNGLWPLRCPQRNLEFLVFSVFFRVFLLVESLIFKAGNLSGYLFLTNLGTICHEQEGIEGFDERIKVELKGFALGSLYVHPKPCLPRGPLTGKP